MDLYFLLLSKNDQYSSLHVAFKEIWQTIKTGQLSNYSKQMSNFQG